MASTAEITNNALKEVGDSLVDKIKKRLAENRSGLGPMNDTLKASDSLSAEVSGNKLVVTGLARLFFLEFGRAPGTWPNVDAIKSWVRSKLNVEEGDVDSVAYLVGKKIYEKGTDIFTDKSQGLRLEIILSLALNTISSEVSDNLARNITLEISSLFEK